MSFLSLLEILYKNRTKIGERKIDVTDRERGGEHKIHLPRLLPRCNGNFSGVNRIKYIDGWLQSAKNY